MQYTIGWVGGMAAGEKIINYIKGEKAKGNRRKLHKKNGEKALKLYLYLQTPVFTKFFVWQAKCIIQGLYACCGLYGRQRV